MKGLFNISLALAFSLLFIALAFLPRFIATRRKASHTNSIRKLALAGVVVSTIGFLSALLGPLRIGPKILILGLIPGALIWLTALIWACLGRRTESTRGFEVQPLINTNRTR
jgi:hypothetical protein